MKKLLGTCMHSVPNTTSKKSQNEERILHKTMRSPRSVYLGLSLYSMSTMSYRAHIWNRVRCKLSKLTILPSYILESTAYSLNQNWRSLMWRYSVIFCSLLCAKSFEPGILKLTNVQSFSVHPSDLVLQCPVLPCQPLRLGPSMSSPAISAMPFYPFSFETVRITAIMFQGEL